jgi:hypothetical protein
MERDLAWVMILCAAIVPAFFTAIPFRARLLICAAGAAFALAARFRGGLAGSASVQEIAWQPDGRWFLTDRRHTWEADLDGGTRVGSAVLLLRWRATDRPAHRTWMLLVPRDLPAGEFRRLLVRVRIDGVRKPVAAESLLA